MVCLTVLQGPLFGTTMASMMVVAQPLCVVNYTGEDLGGLLWVLQQSPPPPPKKNIS